MRIHGAIFDVDGTLLVDSMDIWDIIGADYLRSIGYEPQENLNDVFKNMSLHQASRSYMVWRSASAGLWPGSMLC